MRPGGASEAGSLLECSNLQGKVSLGGRSRDRCGRARRGRKSLEEAEPESGSGGRFSQL